MTNTLDYLDMELIIAIMSFMELAHLAQSYRTFYSRNLQILVIS